MSEEDLKLRESMVLVCKLLYTKGLIAGADGNVSVRASRHGPVLITPSGSHKGLLSADEIVMADDAGNVLKGEGRPSSELPLHLAVYRRDPECMAIVHTHAPWTMALSLTGLGLSPHLTAEGMILLGDVPVVRYEPPGSHLLAEAVIEVLGRSRAHILANHGAITRGESLMKAFELMECLEHNAKITYLARLLAGSAPPSGLSTPVSASSS